MYNKEGFETKYNGGDMYWSSEFKPECCPSEYTRSSGCLCKNIHTRTMLTTRGGSHSETNKEDLLSPYNSCLTNPIASQCI